MQPVPCLGISERPVWFSSDHNTRWRLPYSQNKNPEINRGSPLRRAPLQGCDTSDGLRKDNMGCYEKWLKHVCPPLLRRHSDMSWVFYAFEP